jgi:3-methyladenine DNA glycosylase/8-oxoguanine DNA glycosylase
MTLAGVGPKVADCVLLMSLGYTHVVPIDTHVLQVRVCMRCARNLFTTQVSDYRQRVHAGITNCQINHARIVHAYW